MKRTITFFMTFIMIILCTTGCQRIYIQKNSSSTLPIAAKVSVREVNSPNADTLAYIDDTISYIQCQKDGNVNDIFVDIVNQQLSLIPDNLHNAFTKDGWSIYVTDMNIDQTYYSGQYGRVMATTNFDEQRILIESRQDAAYESPIHEIGHWFDYYVGFPSYTDEFSAIYTSESNTFIRFYGSTCVDNALELFAEGFWQYIIDPGRLQSICPALHNFIKSQYCQLCVRIAAGRLMNVQSVLINNSMIIGLT